MSKSPSNIPITPAKAKSNPLVTPLTSSGDKRQATTSEVDKMATLSGKEHYILQKDAVDLFEDRYGFMCKFYDASVEDIHKNISYYEDMYCENMETLDTMLSKCDTVFDEEDLEYVLETIPEFENIVFYIGDFTYDDRGWINKYEIDAMKTFLVEKMAEYKKFQLELNVNAAVALALLRLQ